MDLNRLTRDADEQIRKVVARYNQLYVPTGAISQVDLDLLLDELRKLYDTFKTIGYINQTRLQNSQKQEVTVSASPVAGIHPSAVQADTSESAAPAKPEPKTLDSELHPQQEVQPRPESKIVPEVINEVPEEKAMEAVTEDFTKPEPAAVPTESEQQPAADMNSLNQETVGTLFEKASPETTDSQAPAMLADRFSPGNRSLSETMASAPANEVVAGRILFQPITDLSAGIGINDRFTFVSELFGNNTGQYQEAITRINKAVNLDEANWIFQKYHTSAWNQKPEVVARMKDFIKRRFI